MIDEIYSILRTIFFNSMPNTAELNNWTVFGILGYIWAFRRFAIKMKIIFEEIKEIDQPIIMAFEDGTPMAFEDGTPMEYEKEDISKICHLKKIFSIIRKLN